MHVNFTGPGDVATAHEDGGAALRDEPRLRSLPSRLNDGATCLWHGSASTRVIRWNGVW